MEVFSTLDDRISMKTEGLWMDYDGTLFFNYLHILFIDETSNEVTEMNFHIYIVFNIRSLYMLILCPSFAYLMS